MQGYRRRVKEGDKTVLGGCMLTSDHLGKQEIRGQGIAECRCLKAACVETSALACLVMSLDRCGR